MPFESELEYMTRMSIANKYIEHVLQKYSSTVLNWKLKYNNFYSQVTNLAQK